MNKPQGQRVNIWFTMETWNRLKKFIIDRYGVRRALSMTVEDAVKLYLDTQEALKGG